MYTALRSELANSFALGSDRYPTDHFTAFDVLNACNAPSAPPPRGQSHHHHFTQVGLAPIAGTNGRIWDAVTCYNCNCLGHYSRDCPSPATYVTIDAVAAAATATYRSRGAGAQVSYNFYRDTRLEMIFPMLSMFHSPRPLIPPLSTRTGFYLMVNPTYAFFETRLCLPILVSHLMAIYLKFIRMEVLRSLCKWVLWMILDKYGTIQSCLQISYRWQLCRYVLRSQLILMKNLLAWDLWTPLADKANGVLHPASSVQVAAG